VISEAPNMRTKEERIEKIARTRAAETIRLEARMIRGSRESYGNISKFSVTERMEKLADEIESG
jgi:hypothetical protein